MSSTPDPTVVWLVGALGTGKPDTSHYVFDRLWRRGTS